MNKRKTIFLHIGTPKTGTTSIQDFLAKNAKILETKGFYYPIVDNCLHETNLRCLLFDTKKNNIWKDIPCFYEQNNDTKKTYTHRFERLFLEKIRKSKCDNIILSDESLSCPQFFRNTLDTFIEVLVEFGFDVKIIIYVRPMPDYLASRWQQQSKVNALSFDEFLKMKLVKAPDTWLKLIDKFGKDNVIVKPFEKAQFKNGNLIEDFLDIFGLQLTDEYTIYPQKNISFGRNHLELLKILHTHKLYIDSKFWQKVLDLAPKDDMKIIESISDEQILKIHNDFKDFYTKLANIYEKESFFINELPKCYAKERQVYDKTTFTAEQIQLLNEALKYNMTKNNAKKDLIEKIFSVKNRRDNKGISRKFVKIFGYEMQLKK